MLAYIKGTLEMKMREKAECAETIITFALIIALAKILSK